MNNDSVVKDYFDLGNMPIKTYKNRYPNPVFLPKLVDLGLGIEVEVENVLGYSSEGSLWQSKEDSSLRNNGREFVTAAIQSQYAMDLLLDLKKRLNKDISFSPRTSIHVHVNCLNLTQDTITKLLLKYLVLERDVFNWVGRAREKSIYCVPMLDSFHAQYNLFKDKILGGDWYKYQALNLLSLQTLGTVEFRHMYGTLDENTLSAWIGIICELFNSVINREESVSELKDRICSLNSTSAYIQFYRDTLGPLGDVLYTGWENPSEGVRYIKSTYGNNPNLEKNSKYFLHHLNGINKRGLQKAAPVFFGPPGENLPNGWQIDTAILEAININADTDQPPQF